MCDRSAKYMLSGLIVVPKSVPNQVRIRAGAQNYVEVNICIQNFRSAYLECATTQLSTCSLAWSVVPARVRIHAGAQNYMEVNSGTYAINPIAYMPEFTLT